VDATQHASFNHAFSDFIKCSKGFYYARRGCAFQSYDDSRACSEHVFQYLSRRSSKSCVPGDVVGKWRRDEKWRPAGIRNRLGIAVTVCRADAGGVGTQSPGAEAGVYGATIAASAPSLARIARIFAATSAPTAMPSVLAEPSGIPESEAA